jgi:nucleoside-diphosphate-sugar epimerase
MKILIIGGTGNISTGITRLLLEQKHEVVHFNNDKNCQADTLGVKQIFGDRMNYPEFEKTMREAGAFDCVIDMIGYEPEDVESDVRAFHGRVGHFIFCSTVDVYTKPAKRYPVREDAERNPIREFAYAYKKALCERILEAAHHPVDFPLTIIRPAATYNDTWCPLSLIGPGPAFLKRIRTGMPVIILGNGQSLWVSSHRDDTARAFAGAVGNSKTIGKAYHAAGEEWITWERYYEITREVMQAPPLKPVFIPARLLARMAPEAASWSDWNFQYNNLFDNTAARADLGFQFTIEWAEGVQRMVEYHDARGNIDSAGIDPLYEKIVQLWSKVEQQAIAGMSE